MSACCEEEKVHPVTCKKPIHEMMLSLVKLFSSGNYLCPVSGTVPHKSHLSLGEDEVKIKILKKCDLNT